MRPVKPYRDAFLRHVKQPPTPRWPAGDHPGARMASTFTHDDVENWALADDGHSELENEGAGLTTVAPVMRERAYDVGLTPRPQVTKVGR